MTRLPPLFRSAALLLVRLVPVRGADKFRLYRAGQNYLYSRHDGARIEDCLPRHRSFKLYLAASVLAATMRRPAVTLIAAIVALPAALLWAGRIVGGA